MAITNVESAGVLEALYLREVGKKRVYLAQDTPPDREVAFALIKLRARRRSPTPGSPAKPRPWVALVSILTSSPGTRETQPYMVTELMGGGDVEGIIENADNQLATPISPAYNSPYTGSPMPTDGRLCQRSSSATAAMTVLPMPVVFTTDWKATLGRARFSWMSTPSSPA